MNYMCKELKNSEKYKILQLEFEKFYKAEREVLPEGKGFEILVLHDIERDLSDEEYKTLINSKTSDDVKKIIFNVLLMTKALSRDERLIIKYEFLDRENPVWWTQYFSRSQYYRRRKETVDKVYRLMF